MKLTNIYLFQAFLTYEDLNFDWDVHKWHSHTFTLKKKIVESERKFTELTWCTRLYSLAYAYTQVGFFDTFVPKEFEKPNVAEGYTENIRKLWSALIRAPSETPYDVVSWLRSSNEGYETTKNEWSYFREAEKALDALEWQSICFVYSVANKNTGIVINGEILADKRHSDDWASNEFNFLPSIMFQPYNSSSDEWGDGR